MIKGGPRTLWRPSRRDVFFLGIGGLIAAVPMARRPRLSLVRRHVVTMGTIGEFVVAHHDAGAAHAAIDRAIEALVYVDLTMSRFKLSSDIGRANSEAAARAVPIGADTAMVLHEALWWAEASGGCFDPCLGGATSLWNIGGRTVPPPPGDVEKLAGRRLYSKLDVGTFAGTPVVRFEDPDVRIDLGGIAKGFAVDLAVARLRESGIEHALVGAGGDLYALGRSPSGDRWTVGIQSPDNPRELAGELQLENEAIATSGDYQQFFEYRAKRYHHLLDPTTAMPFDTTRRSASVVAETCMRADAGATLAFGAASRDAVRVLARRHARIAHLI